MNFVTIAWSKDFNMMLLQAHSLKFVNDNIVHYVVIQDSILSIEQWQNALSTYYDRHKLVLVPNLLENESLTSNGWIQQQILKFKISKLITTEDYLVLDTKNFFIKPFNLNDWSVPHGNGSLFVYRKGNKNRMDVDKFLEGASSTYNKEIPNIHIDYMTPYKLNKKIVDSMNINDNLSLFLDYNKYGLPCDFALYIFFIPKEIIFKCSVGTANLVSNFFKTVPSLDQLEKGYTTSYVIGMHRRLIIEENKNKLNNLIEVLSSKGLDKHLLDNTFGGVAQLGERLLCKQ